MNSLENAAETFRYCCQRREGKGISNFVLGGGSMDTSNFLGGGWLKIPLGDLTRIWNF